MPGERGDSFQGRGVGGGGCNLNIKNKNLKYLTRKKVYKQTFFSVITKNLNGELLWGFTGKSNFFL